MDRQVAFLSVFLLGLAIASLSMGCKTADEGPRPFVMPFRPTMNVPPPSTSEGRPYPPSQLIPSGSVDKNASAPLTRPSSKQARRSSSGPTYLR